MRANGLKILKYVPKSACRLPPWVLGAPLWLAVPSEQSRKIQAVLSWGQARRGHCYQLCVCAVCQALC